MRPVYSLPPPCLFALNFIREREGERGREGFSLLLECTTTGMWEDGFGKAFLRGLGSGIRILGGELRVKGGKKGGGGRKVGMETKKTTAWFGLLDGVLRVIGHQFR